MMSLMGAMHLWELCTEVKGDNWGGERSSLLLFVMLLLLLLLGVGGGGGRASGRRTVKATNYEKWGETSHQTCEYCLKAT